MAKNTTKQPPAVKAKTTTSDRLDLSKHTVTEILQWRNTASKRVDKARARMEAIAKEYVYLNKKAHSDIKWIRRLHNELARQVFGHRPHDKAPKALPDIIK